MIRKMLLIASAVAIPLGATAVTAVSGSPVAGAVTPLAISCTLGNPTVTFAPPGISQNGSFNTSPTSTTTTSAQTLNCGANGTGTGPANSITTASTQCTGTNTPVTGCSAGMYNYDSVSGFSATSGTLWKSLPTITSVIKGVTYKSTSYASAGTVCSGGELGFKIKGHLSTPTAHAGEVTKVVICLGSDTGTGTTGSFTNDFNKPGVTIATAVLANDSKLKIS